MKPQRHRVCVPAIPMGEFAPYSWNAHPIFYLGPCEHFTARGTLRIMSEQGGILVSEDDPDDLFFLKRAFARAGLAERTTFVKDGSGVIKYLAGVAPYENRELHPLPKLVLLDLAMPEVSGLEVLQWLRGQTMPTEIPIVVFTGTEAPGQIHRALSLGARRCLPKTGAVNGWGDMIQHLAVEFGICPLIPALSLQPGETRKAA